jgi:hypothetical protein
MKNTLCMTPIAETIVTPQMPFAPSQRAERNKGGRLKGSTSEGITEGIKQKNVALKDAYAWAAETL